MKSSKPSSPRPQLFKPRPNVDVFLMCVSRAGDGVQEGVKADAGGGRRGRGHHLWPVPGDRVQEETGELQPCR